MLYECLTACKKKLKTTPIVLSLKHEKGKIKSIHLYIDLSYFLFYFFASEKFKKIKIRERFFTIGVCCPQKNRRINFYGKYFNIGKQLINFKCDAA